MSIIVVAKAETPQSALSTLQAPLSAPTRRSGRDPGWQAAHPAAPHGRARAAKARFRTQCARTRKRSSPPASASGARAIAWAAGASQTSTVPSLSDATTTDRIGCTALENVSAPFQKVSVRSQKPTGSLPQNRENRADGPRSKIAGLAVAIQLADQPLRRPSGMPAFSLIAVTRFLVSAKPAVLESRIRA